MKIVETISTATKRPIFFSLDRNYIDCFIVALQSLYDNAKGPAEVHVLTDDMDSKGLEKDIRQMTSIPDKCTLNVHFIDNLVDTEGQELKGFSYISRVAYFKLLVPNLVPEADMALHIDADMCIMHSLDELFDTKMDDGQIVAGCEEFEFMWQIPKSKGSIKGHVPPEIKDRMAKEYGSLEEWYRKEMGMDLETCPKYMNVGLCLFDVKKCIEFGLMEKAFRLIEEQYAKNGWCHMVEQDTLNSVCKGKIKWLDPKWNAMWAYATNYAIKIKFQRKKLDEEALKYKESIQGAHIWHYLCSKPWNKPYMDYDMAMHWWRACRRTPVFERMLSRLSPTVQRNLLERLEDQKGSSIENFF